MIFDKKNKRPPAFRSREEMKTIGSNVSFAAKEAYKLLRTNLSYILTDAENEGCHIIGMTSSLRGEGKSTTSINLAFVLSEMNKRVLLIDADLRIPSLHKKVRLRGKPGLSNMLINRDVSTACIQHYHDKKGVEFDVLTAGDIPPNPSELLGSKRMQRLLDHLSQQYDYIILDLPPVTAVTDSLVATKLVDGVIVVVRSDYSDRNSLNETLRQIKLVNGRILGFVLTCASGGGAGYRYRYRYRYRYYRRYHYGYHSGHQK